MKAITKQELMAMIDNALPDDATLNAFSGVTGEAMEITPDTMHNLIMPYTVFESDEDAEAMFIDGATHILYFE